MTNAPHALRPVAQFVREPLALRMARAATETSIHDLPIEVITKVKVCLYDIIGCAFEARDCWDLISTLQRAPSRLARTPR